MKVFIWGRINQCSGNYHSEGGVVVFASDEATARQIANNTDDVQISPEEMPDVVRDVVGGIEAIYTFPDAGCC